MTILKSSINPKSEVFGDYSEEVSDTYKLMASIHLSTGEIEKALRSYKKVKSQCSLWPCLIACTVSVKFSFFFGFFSLFCFCFVVLGSFTGDIRE